MHLNLASIRVGADTPDRPAIAFNRWAEDWSVLADPDVPREPLDELKYIPLSNDDARTYLSLGANVRERFEVNAANFGTDGNQQDSYLFKSGPKPTWICGFTVRYKCFSNCRATCRPENNAPRRLIKTVSALSKDSSRSRNPWRMGWWPSGSVARKMALTFNAFFRYATGRTCANRTMEFPLPTQADLGASITLYTHPGTKSGIRLRLTTTAVRISRLVSFG